MKWSKSDMKILWHRVKKEAFYKVLREANKFYPRPGVKEWFYEMNENFGEID